jgi:photosystem II stability/assembly factor-like uncharacterized protein
MFSTANGGQSWTSFPTPAVKNAGILVMSCASASDCVALWQVSGPGGQGIQEISYATSDSGQTWTEASVPGTFRAYALQCFTGGLCIAGGEMPNGYKISDPTLGSAAAAIYSTDGGLSWVSGSVPQTFPAGMLVGLSCADPNHCMAVEKPGGRPDHNVVVTTSDSGRTWTPSPTSEPANFIFSSISCPTASDCWVSGGTSTSGVILSTHDAGQTWTSEALPAIQGATPRMVGSVSCPSVTGCLALASGATSYSTGRGQLVLSNESSSTTSGANTATSR